VFPGIVVALEDFIDSKLIVGKLVWIKRAFKNGSCHVVGFSRINGRIRIRIIVVVRVVGHHGSRNWKQEASCCLLK